MPLGGEESASLPRGGRAAGEPGPQRRSWPVLRLCARGRRVARLRRSWGKCERFGPLRLITANVSSSGLSSPAKDLMLSVRIMGYDAEHGIL